MGNLFTKSLPPATPEGVKFILNTILQEMFKRADFIDLYSLADPERCKRYIVVAETALQKLFVKIRLNPKLGADGTFMVQKLEGLQRKNPLGDDQPRYCLELAFYFIRIFQIYAALALSVMDGDLPVQEIQTLRRANNARIEDAILLKPDTLPGFPQAGSTKKGFLSSFLGIGGALTGDASYKTFYLSPDAGAGVYTILNRFLVRPPTGSVSMDPMRFERYSDMIIPQEALYSFSDGGAGSRRTKETLSQTPPSIIYTLPGDELRARSETIYAELKLVRNGSMLQVTLANPHLESRPGKTEESVQGELYYKTSTDENPKSTTGQDLPDLIASLFKEIAVKARPTVVSVIPFLLKFKYLKRLEGDVPIEGTRIVIRNPKSLFTAGITDVPILYKDTFKPEKGGGDRSITLETVLTVTKADTIIGKPHTYTVSVKLKDMDIEPAEFQSRFAQANQTASSTFQTGFNDTEIPRNTRAQTVPEYLQKLFEGIVAGKGSDPYTGGIEFKKGIPQPYNSDTLAEPLKVKTLWQALARDPPMKSYCVARAVQLLNVAAIRGEMSLEAYTNVCRMKFPYVQEGYVPAPGKPITSVPGIRAVDLLFYDMIEKGTPKIAASDKYTAFVKNMKAAFEGPAAVATETSTLNSVQDRATAAACVGQADGKLSVPSDAVSSLRKQALALVDRQKNHIANVMPLLYKMFDQTSLQTKKQLAFNPTFAAGGMAAVNQLGEEARALLIEYYSDCETLYKGGLAVLAAKMPRSTAQA
jgi:hypothetical protein